MNGVRVHFGPPLQMKKQALVTSNGSLFASNSEEIRPLPDPVQSVSSVVKCKVKHFSFTTGHSANGDLERFLPILPFVQP